MCLVVLFSVLIVPLARLGGDLMRLFVLPLSYLLVVDMMVVFVCLLSHLLVVDMIGIGVCLFCL